MPLLQCGRHECTGGGDGTREKWGVRARQGCKPGGTAMAFSPVTTESVTLRFISLSLFYYSRLVATVARLLYPYSLRLPNW